MSFKDSYLYKIRQKVGHDELIVPGVDVVAVRDEKVCLVFNKDFQVWTLPGGAAEPEDSWQGAAARELREEAGIIASLDVLVPFATLSGSGWRIQYDNGDKSRCFTVGFCCQDFQESNLPLDDSEIARLEWFALSELDNVEMTKHSRAFLDAYLDYRHDHEFKQIVWNMNTD